MESGNGVCDGPWLMHFLCFQMIKGFWGLFGVMTACWSLILVWLTFRKLNPDAAWFPQILDDTKYACTAFVILSPKEFWYVCSRHAVPALANPFCKWKLSEIAGPQVNFHFLSLRISTPTFFFLLILFNTQSFPWGEWHAVSAAGRQKQRGTWREIQGLSVYGRVTLYCSKCIRD